jgi:hypothetical protein
VHTSANILVDASAAALILTSYLGRINGNTDEFSASDPYENGSI